MDAAIKGAIKHYGVQLLHTLPVHFWRMEYHAEPSLQTPRAPAAGDDDSRLMLDYRAGNAQAFEALYTRHKGGLYRYIGRCAGLGTATALSQSECDEVFQDVWMRVIEARDRYEPSAQFRTWLYTIAHHRVMDFFRSRKPTHLAIVAGAGESDSDESGSMLAQLPANAQHEPQNQAQARQQGQAIMNALEALPVPQREAFLLYEESGLSVQEIADVTGVSFEAAKSRLRYAYKRLREQLKDLL